MNAPQPMLSSSRFFKVIVQFERRPDGGLRAWSDHVPGFVLSHSDVDALLSDIKPALETILSARFGTCITTDPLDDLRLQLEDEGVIDPPTSESFERREYVAHCA